MGLHLVVHLLKLRRKGVVRGAKLSPLLSNNLGFIASDIVLGSFTHDHRQARFQMPIDVAMEDPWTRVVSEEANGRVTTVDSYSITFDGINEIPGSAVRRLDDIECVTVKMEGVSTRSWDVHFNRLVTGKDEEMFRRNEVLGLSRTRENLK